LKLCFFSYKEEEEEYMKYSNMKIVVQVVNIFY